MPFPKKKEVFGLHCINREGKDRAVVGLLSHRCSRTWASPCERVNKRPRRWPKHKGLLGWDAALADKKKEIRTPPLADSGDPVPLALVEGTPLRVREWPEAGRRIPPAAGTSHSQLVVSTLALTYPNSA